MKKKTFKDQNEDKNNKEKPDNVHKLLDLRLKRRHTINGPDYFERQQKGIEKKDDKTKPAISKSITNDFYDAKDDEEKKKVLVI